MRSGNCEAYPNRGWCFCEKSWATMVKSSLKVWDLGEVTCQELGQLGEWAGVPTIACTRSVKN